MNPSLQGLFPKNDIVNSGVSNAIAAKVEVASGGVR